jgi:hypothetical protein
MRCFFLGFAGFLLAALLTMFAVASHGNYAARASLGETFQSINPLKLQITEIVIKQNSVSNAGMAIDTPIAKQSFPNTDYLEVSNDGTIIFRSKKDGHIVVLTPSLISGSVSWNCLGSKPDKNLPTTCRQ